MVLCRYCGCRETESTLRTCSTPTQKHDFSPFATCSCGARILQDEAAAYTGPDGVHSIWSCHKAPLPQKDLRDEFAMAALPNVVPRHHSPYEDHSVAMAKESYEIADAMLAARKPK